MNELGVKAATLWLPPDRESAPDGELSAADVERIGVTELYVSQGDLAPPQMAVRAAESTLEKSRFEPADIGLLAHSFSYHQGFDMWSPAHYVAHQAGIPDALPVNIQQLCNGGAVALHLAAKWLAATPASSAALITTADRFCAPGFNRWASDDDAAYSDSATAVLLGRPGEGDDFLRLLSLEMVTDSEWEAQMRGLDEFTTVPLGHGAPIDLRRANKVFRESGEAARLVKLGLPKLHELVLRALGAAEIGPADLSRIALPRLTRTMREGMFKPAISEIVGGNPRYLECGTGCLGAGDFLANLVDIEASLEPGEFGMIVQGTGGFTFTCAVVQRPE
ncbi:ketoacyl-ACP synthase III family protein [Frankia sp. AgB32]|uniref:ketoacyl-ACP synthase III family protein n=1 Tax=Frankia sp. AgB32 TaxID=631119 RepID=UPI00200FCA10|nr:ketoacyl-ACP synthase III family protein [Frankia sp. AgB32]MCK9893450.1 ketoacyl-ACP synthase III family protein [Frankia sp. AgB32]